MTIIILLIEASLGYNLHALFLSLLDNEIVQQVDCNQAKVISDLDIHLLPAVDLYLCWTN